MDFGPALPPWLQQQQQPQPQPQPSPAPERCRQQPSVRSYNPLARDAASSASTSESEHDSSDDDDSEYDEEVRWRRMGVASTIPRRRSSLTRCVGGEWRIID